MWDIRLAMIITTTATIKTPIIEKGSIKRKEKKEIFNYFSFLTYTVLVGNGMPILARFKAS